jgi:hypothetical protein
MAIALPHFFLRKQEGLEPLLKYIKNNKSKYKKLQPRESSRNKKEGEKNKEKN